MADLKQIGEARGAVLGVTLDQVFFYFLFFSFFLSFFFQNKKPNNK